MALILWCNDATCNSHRVNTALAVGCKRTGAGGTCSGAGANPLVYNFEIGGYAAKVINDASFSGPLPGLFTEDPVVLSRALRRRFLNDTADGVAFNILYIDKDGEGVLIDTGLGAARGSLFEKLETEGISRDSIKHVLLTHGHGDHLSGLVLNNTVENPVPAFPSATVYISRIEYEYWTTDPVCSLTAPRVGTATLPFKMRYNTMSGSDERGQYRNRGREEKERARVRRVREVGLCEMREIERGRDIYQKTF